MSESERISWDQAAQTNFEKILEQIPALIRPIAEIRVTNKAKTIITKDDRHVIEEKDMIDAFFSETPPDFVKVMKNGMQELGIDYTQYGYEK